MPELPEVETIRRDLAKKIVGKKITAVLVLDKKIISVGHPRAGGDPVRLRLDSRFRGNDKLFVSLLKGNKIIATDRRGKLLAFKLQSGQFLLIHLKMTGQLIYPVKSPQRGGSAKGGAFNRVNIIAGGHKLSPADLQVPNKFTRVIFNFSDGGKLFFNDMRRFGYMKIVSPEEKNKIWQNDFGIEPLTSNFTWSAFEKLFQNRQTNLKALLMNQKLIAGLGNIYADEVCFCARVLPWRKIKSLTNFEIKKIFSCITKILKIAIKNRGTTFRSFVDSSGAHGGHYNFLNVYERDGEKCRRCKTIIKKTRHAGRGTHYCPHCQK